MRFLSHNIATLEGSDLRLKGLVWHRWESTIPQPKVRSTASTPADHNANLRGKTESCNCNEVNKKKGRKCSLGQIGASSKPKHPPPKPAQDPGACSVEPRPKNQ